MFVPSPEPGRDPQDLFRECQDALEPYFNSMVGRGVNAGWKELVVTEAIIALAERHGLTLASNDGVLRLIKRIPPLD